MVSNLCPQLLQVHTQFVDTVPTTMIDWPRDEGYVQPRTVFMIMPRYPFTLAQFVRSRIGYNPDAGRPVPKIIPCC
jgi:hypothetical protein